MKLIFEGIRCFRERQEVEIKPITLLVGENSTGKTTFLALNRIAWDIVMGDRDLDIFNEEPFMLGTFDQFVSNFGRIGGKAELCRVEMVIPITPKNGQRKEVTVKAEYKSRKSQLILHSWDFIYDQYFLGFAHNYEGIADYIKTMKINKDIKSHIMYLGRTPKYEYIADQFIHKIGEKPSDWEAAYPHYSELLDVTSRVKNVIGKRPIAFAPARTTPKRTYDPMKGIFDPEGSHTPMLLARILNDASDFSTKYKRSLEKFGKDSGLFKKIEVKRKGRSENDPFQIVIKTFFQTSNLIDVGYGISQVLPILVDTILGEPNSTYLLQQPEVHLHPKAQAELGTFLAALAKEHKKRFIIETHGDYIIDRIRMDVRDKDYLTPDDVALLYFERCKDGVKIHTLHLDDQGNILDAPASYGQFFLQEGRKLLGL
ncbi:MAG: AAA family ATPase [bacterium]|nr:AAA family ATPase [bacterium]